jgi:hypothetical protein
LLIKGSSLKHWRNTSAFTSSSRISIEVCDWHEYDFLTGVGNSIVDLAVISSGSS